MLHVFYFDFYQSTFRIRVTRCCTFIAPHAVPLTRYFA